MGIHMMLNTTPVSTLSCQTECQQAQLWWTVENNSFLASKVVQAPLTLSIIAALTVTVVHILTFVADAAW